MRYPPSVTFGFATLALVCAMAVALHFSDWPGETQPTYRARDHDPKLEQDAAKAKPVIDAMEKYHAKNAAYPATAAELAPYLTGTLPAAAAPNSVNGWVYARNANGKGYQLAYKLGLDAGLLYEFDGSGGMWVFAPGNGAANKEIQLGQ